MAIIAISIPSLKHVFEKLLRKFGLIGRSGTSVSQYAMGSMQAHNGTAVGTSVQDSSNGYHGTCGKSVISSEPGSTLVGGSINDIKESRRESV